MAERRRREREVPLELPAFGEVPEVQVGIPDERSYLRTQYYPSGSATGWRRTGCLVMILVVGTLTVVCLLVLAAN